MSDLYSPGGRDHGVALLVGAPSRAFRRRRRPQLRIVAARLALAVAAIWTIAFGIGIVLH